MTDNIETPDWLFGIFEEWWDPCPLDPSPQFDALQNEWLDPSYVNPPYSKPLPWVKKAIEESKKGKRIVMLLKADPSTEYYRLCNKYGRILYFERRIKFKGQKSTANFPSMLVIFNETKTDLKR